MPLERMLGVTEQARRHAAGRSVRERLDVAFGRDLARNIRVAGPSPDDRADAAECAYVTA